MQIKKRRYKIRKLAIVIQNDNQKVNTIQTIESVKNAGF